MSEEQQQVRHVHNAIIAPEQLQRSLFCIDLHWFTMDCQGITKMFDSVVREALASQLDEQVPRLLELLEDIQSL